MNINYQLLGKQIRRIRTQQNLSQASLAELVDCSTAFISRIENGKKKLSLDLLVALANALCVTTDAFLIDSLQYNVDSNLADFRELLESCTAYERRVIVESARSQKRILRENRHLLHRRSQ